MKCSLRMIVLLSVCALHGCAATVVGGTVGGAALVAQDPRTTGSFIEDQAIELKAYAALRREPDTASKVHASFTSYDRVVLISGEANDAQARERVAELVRTIPNVRKVHNELNLAAPSAIPSRWSDAYVTTKVKSRFLSTEGVNPLRIKVVTENGTVYLMGIVSRQEAEAATQVARTTAGVQRVVRLFDLADE